MAPLTDPGAGGCQYTMKPPFAPGSAFVFRGSPVGNWFVSGVVPSCVCVMGERGGGRGGGRLIEANGRGRKGGERAKEESRGNKESRFGGKPKTRLGPQKKQSGFGELLKTERVTRGQAGDS